MRIYIRHKTLSLFLLLLFTFTIFPNGAGQACINDGSDELHLTLNGYFPEGELPKDYALQFQNALDARAVDKIGQLRDKYRKKPNTYTSDPFYKEQDAALTALLSKNAAQAVEQFIALDRKYPGRYSTAVNLGTAYELNGDNEKALTWIREGMKRNPDSHLGTEWLHIEILKTKIKLGDDTHALDLAHVIDIPESFVSKPGGTLSFDGIKLSPELIEKALDYQLLERMVFVKPKDPVVADLLFTLSRFIAHRHDVSEALKILKIAENYGFKNQSLLDDTRKLYEEKAVPSVGAAIHGFSIVRFAGGWALSISILFLLLPILIVTIIKKLKKRRART